MLYLRHGEDMIVLKKFVLKDVRCFAGAQEFNIRPLTFLVGENSTGKSTLLGCMQALGNVVGASGKGDFQFDFNAEPFQMGAFADIARNAGNRAGGISDSFDLGFGIQIDERVTVDLLFTLIERESGSEPAVQRLKMEFDDLLIFFELARRDDAENTRFHGVDGPIERTTQNGKPVYTFKINGAERELLLTIQALRLGIPFMGTTKQHEEQYEELRRRLKGVASHLPTTPQGVEYIDSIMPLYWDFYFESFSPIRSKPKRTYDPVREVSDPEGGGMPGTLMNMSRTNQGLWQGMQKKLMEFGKASGLFTGIDIRKLGQSVNDPFQLQVKAIGPKTNMIDVGYGVSQILPVLVRIIQARRGTHFLVQQPEVHLHPKGQAELISFLIDMNNERNKGDEGRHSFILETHSDAMINRARIAILNKQLKPEDVSLIYLEPAGNKVKVHNISFDPNANMLDVPGSYRDFFLREHDKLLGFGD